MARHVARLNDKTMGTCSVHGNDIEGKIITASPNTFANKRGIARLHDKVEASCGHTAVIITASPNDKTNKRGTARLNDKVQGDEYVAKIITASPNVSVN